MNIVDSYKEKLSVPESQTWSGTAAKAAILAMTMMAAMFVPAIFNQFGPLFEGISDLTAGFNEALGVEASGAAVIGKATAAVAMTAGTGAAILGAPLAVRGAERLAVNYINENHEQKLASGQGQSLMAARETGAPEQPALDTRQPALDTRQPALDTRQPALDTRQPAVAPQQPEALQGSPTTRQLSEQDLALASAAREAGMSLKGLSVSVGPSVKLEEAQPPVTRADGQVKEVERG